MHNWLIFQYRRIRAHTKSWLLRGCLFGDEPTHREEVSNEGTQEGR
jgi:hypothetical protein